MDMDLRQRNLAIIQSAIWNKITYETICFSENILQTFLQIDVQYKKGMNQYKMVRSFFSPKQCNFLIIEVVLMNDSLHNNIC